MAIATFHRSILLATGMAFFALLTLWTVPGSVLALEDDKEDYKWTEPKGKVLVKNVKDDDAVEVKGNTWRFNDAVLYKNQYYQLATSPCMNDYVPNKDAIVVSFHISEVVSFEKIGMQAGKDTWKVRVKNHK